MVDRVTSFYELNGFLGIIKNATKDTFVRIIIGCGLFSVADFAIMFCMRVVVTDDLRDESFYNHF